jgi:flagellar hook-basal body complex protein FliE
MAQARGSNSANAAASAAAELAVIADTIERHRERVAALATPFLGTEREDIVIAIHEAERQLSIAARAVRRGVKSLER